MKMLDDIKAYWDSVKTDYENRYQVPFLSEFETSKDYLEKMKSYLLSRQKDFPADVDVVCTLASVELELREGRDNCAKLLETFLDSYDETLEDRQKARVYTNMAFYHDYSKEALDCLTKAKALNSPFVETYTGLGLYHFAEYEFDKAEKNSALSRDYFNMAKNLADNYVCVFNYAISLYELKDYESAKAIFLDLLKLYPNRMRLLLCLAYCELYLGNKEKVVSYLAQVKLGQDERYTLDTDDIVEYEIFDVYYLLDEYDTFIRCYENVLDSYYTADWEHYFYALWLKNEKALFAQLEEKNRAYFEKAIEEAKLDEDYESEAEKQEIIADWEVGERDFDQMMTRIKAGSPKPAMQLSLSPEYVCFMVDCVRHRF